MTITRILYNLAFPVVLVLLLPGFLFRMLRRGKYRHKFGQRFGIYSRRVREKLARHRWIWVHAVSVGEVLIAVKLIQALRARDAAARIVLSTTTSTGYALAARHRCDAVEPIYNPVDFLWIVRRAIGLIRPTHVVLVEAEVWPNLTAEARLQGARLGLVNARLSKRSERRFRMARPFAAAVFNQLDVVAVADGVEAARWRGLGVEEGKICVTGSIKFDDTLAPLRSRRDFRPLLEAVGVVAGAPLIVAGSTHAGEERLLADIVRQLREQFPTLFLVVVPRHAERWRDARADMVAAGLRVALRSEPAEPADALLVNTTGELRDWYDCADVVFVGKSLTAHGGQNPAEPISAGRAVVFGPNMENFQTLADQLVREGGARQVADAAALAEALRELLTDPAARGAMAERGAACLAVHRGATSRTCDVLGFP